MILIMLTKNDKLSSYDPYDFNFFDKSRADNDDDSGYFIKCGDRHMATGSWPSILLHAS